MFEHVSVKFADGNRYGLIGANGCGKSTLMKILGGELEPSSGEVVLQAGHAHRASCNQNQFGYEDQRVLDVVMQGHVEMWHAMQERDRIYADANATDDDYMHAAELEAKFAEYGGYNAEARAGSILIDAGIDRIAAQRPDARSGAGLKLRVLLAQALFSKPDVLLLDEPTNNLDINSIRWLERRAQRLRRHDDHHQPRPALPEPGVHAHRRPGFPAAQDLPGQLRRLHARPRCRRAQRVEAANAKAKDADLGPAGVRAALLGQCLEGAPGHVAQAADREDQDRGDQALLAPESVHPLRAGEKAVSLGGDRREAAASSYPGTDAESSRTSISPSKPSERVAIIGPNGIGKTTLMRCLAGDLQPTTGRITWVENAAARLHAAGSAGGVREKTDLFTWMSTWTGKADDEQIVRATLGACCSRATRCKKSVKVLSGGEKGRMIYGKLMLTRPNVMLMDEPTNHMDMETIESLQIGLEKYPGTLIFVSHDREFVGGAGDAHDRAAARRQLRRFHGHATTSTSRASASNSSGRRREQTAW